MSKDPKTPTDVDQLRGILKQFSSGTIAEAVRHETGDEALSALSTPQAIMIAVETFSKQLDRIEGCLRGEGEQRVFRHDPPHEEHPETGTTGITLQCGKSADLSSRKEGEEDETDYHDMGDTAEEVQREAIEGAEKDAKKKAERDLERQVRTIHCLSGCTLTHPKITGTGTISTPGEITQPPDVRQTLTHYHATAWAKAEVEVKCVASSDTSCDEEQS